MTDLEFPVSIEQFSAQELLLALKNHAIQTLVDSPTNALYSDSVMQRILEVQELMSNRSGVVEGVISSWMPQVVPIAEQVFGSDFSQHLLGEYQEFMPTSLPGIMGRLKIISIDEINGPTVTLDLAAQTFLGQ